MPALNSLTIKQGPATRVVQSPAQQEAVVRMWNALLGGRVIDKSKAN